VHKAAGRFGKFKGGDKTGQDTCGPGLPPTSHPDSWPAWGLSQPCFCPRSVWQNGAFLAIWILLFGRGTRRCPEIGAGCGPALRPLNYRLCSAGWRCGKWPCTPQA